MSDSSLLYFRADFVVNNKPERLVLVIDPVQRKIVFADYEENAVDLAKQMEEKYLDQKED